MVKISKGFPGGSVVKNPASAGDMSLILGLGRSPGEGNGNSLQYSCLGNPMDREAWWATVHGVRERVRQDLGTKQQQQKPVKWMLFPIVLCLFSLEWLVVSSVFSGCPFRWHPWWPVPRGAAHPWIQSLPPGSRVFCVFAAHSTSWLVSLSLDELSTGLPVLPPACVHLFSDFYLRSFPAGWVCLGPKAGRPVGFVEEVVSGGRQENQWQFPETFRFQQTPWFWTCSELELWLGAATDCRVGLRLSCLRSQTQDT